MIHLIYESLLGVKSKFVSQFEFKILSSHDHELISLITNWYHEEWKIPLDKSFAKIKSVLSDETQLQIIMTIDSVPIATGGIYHHVGLLDHQPKFKIHKHWLGLVYTIPEMRRNGYGALLCEQLEFLAKQRRFSELYLFSDTAVDLYARLGWEKVEMVPLGSRLVTVMKKIMNE
ncbi:GNAT family N-acetyltransferase [Leptospira levettii]|uniref:GNAT family N-acetyltransferase n=1 Tax=Leptospira levettii TaxID=2023178 RepID=UPI001FAEB0D8|nr:GNAT family N-acetyltransferase [Leptospira levettii]MCW7474921.1 GNAT family N-acetyltransferase [Leptospira levettii]